MIPLLAVAELSLAREELAALKKAHERLRKKLRDRDGRLRKIRKESFSPALHDARRNIQEVADLRNRKWRDV